MYPNNDYNVLLLFYNNFEKTKLVFEQIRKNKPKNLFLFQDGAGNDEKNLKKILKIRKYILDNIDWKCNVYKRFLKEDLGADPCEYIAQKWAFSIVDKCIVLEDDDVPCDSFFEFCWTLLNKYENDKRIGIICGYNTLTTYNESKNYNYFFTSSGSIWGWASWRHFIDLWDENYSWLDDKNSLLKIRKFYSNEKDYTNLINRAKKYRLERKPVYEIILGVASILHDKLNIVPTKNIVCSIGCLGGGTNTVSNLKLMPKKIRKLYNKPTFEIKEKLKGPDTFEDDIQYKNKVNQILRPNKIVSIYYAIKKRIFRIIGLR